MRKDISFSSPYASNCAHDDCIDSSWLITLFFPIVNCTHPGVFVCGNAHCIPLQRECDGFDNCGDNSDEEHCSNSNVPLSPFFSWAFSTTAKIIIVGASLAVLFCCCCPICIGAVISCVVVFKRNKHHQISPPVVRTVVAPVPTAPYNPYPTQLGQPASVWLLNKYMHTHAWQDFSESVTIMYGVLYLSHAVLHRQWNRASICIWTINNNKTSSNI